MSGKPPPVFCVFVLLVASAFAQQPNGISSGTLRGVLHDQDGRPLVDASVSATPSSAKVASSITTSQNGNFELKDLVPGDYQISVNAHGNSYKSERLVSIAAGQTVRVELALLNSRTVRVLFSEAAAGSEASGGEHLSSGEVSSLPLNSRDFSKLLLLAAGTMTDTNGAANFTQQFAVNGQRGNATVFAVDGADTTDPEMGGATFSNFNVDAIQEVQASSGVMPAEIGHGGASYTNVVSKSGVDQIHGSVFEFIRNAAFDARNYFDRPTAISNRRIPPFVRNEFGFAIGGPVVIPGIYNGHGRTFFFGEYQGFRQVLGTTQVLPVPTAAERQGIDTTTFPGDSLTVPISPKIVPILDRYPLPNVPRGPYGDRTYEASSKVSTSTDQVSIRVDHRISEKASVVGRFSLNQVTGPVTNPDQTAIDPSFGIQFFDHQRNATVRYSRVLSSHISTETSLSYIRSTPFFPAVNHTQPALGFGDGLFQGYNSPGGSIFGSYGNLYQFREDMTAVYGAHTFKWGTEIRVNRDSTIFGISPNGAYSFAGGTAYSPVFIPSASGTHNINAGDQLPDSLLGLLTATPYSYTTTAAAAFTPTGNKFDEAGVRREAYNFYFEDTWKASPRLTLNYGLRYEVNSRIHEATKRTSLPRFLHSDGTLADYRDRTAKQIFAVDPQPPYNQDWSGFGPRLSVDYSLSPHTVWHAAGAITTLIPNLWQDNFLTAGLPFAFTTFISTEPGVPIPFSNTFVPLALPTSYATNGQPVFPSGTTTSVRPNTILDLSRWQADISALTPGDQLQLPSVSGIDRNFRNGYIGTFTAGVDHDFKDVKLSAAYVGTAGIHLARVYSPNGYVGADPAFAPYTQFDSSGHAIGGYGVESLISSGSHSSYHALQTSLTKNSARAGLGLQASYTYSKSLDDTSAVLGNLLGSAGVILQTQPQNPFDPGAEKGPSTFDVTHVFSASVIQLLYLDRVGFLHSLPKALTSGWQFLNITTLTSGSPFTVFSGVQQTGAGAGGTDRPDLLAKPQLSTSRTVRDDYFGRGTDNAAFFSIPINLPGGTGPNHGRFGTLGRDTFRGPAYHDFDIALIKDTPVGHRGNAELATVEFRAEFFNIFNIVNFGLPDNILRGSGFGIISRTAGTSRQIQFSLKLIY
ncbi:MAG TPA: carboxypeptidase-like regulatory domain-containing protein [Terriglobales bacterium]|nr:carboxypeptidase-like regulatory domain-containing protein [Terriglobales bacterium]